MKLNRIVQRDKPSPIHSSGFVQNVDRIGSTAVDPFSKRLQRDRSRQTVGGYRDARVLHQGRSENRDSLASSRRDDADLQAAKNNVQSTDPRRGSRIDIVRPPTPGVSPLAPSSRPQAQQRTFREPPSRHRP